MNEEIANYIRTQILLRTDPGHDIGDDELSDLINRILIEIKSKYIIIKYCDVYLILSRVILLL